MLALLRVIKSLPVTVERNSVLPEEVPASGLLILRDGDQGEPETTMSPLLYHFEHVAELEIFVPAPDADTRFDDLRQLLGPALSLDRTLEGTVDWIEWGAPAPTDLPFPGAAGIKEAVIPITLFYATRDPLT